MTDHVIAVYGVREPGCDIARGGTLAEAVRAAMRVLVPEGEEEEDNEDGFTECWENPTLERLADFVEWHDHTFVYSGPEGDPEGDPEGERINAAAEALRRLGATPEDLSAVCRALTLAIGNDDGLWEAVTDADALEALTNALERIGFARIGE